MSLITEIHNQKPAVRYALFVFSVVLAVSVIGFFWFGNIQERMFMALHSDPAEQAAFLAARDAQGLHPLAAISRGLGSLTASIGSLLGFDRSKGFDRPAGQDTVHLLPLSD